MATVANRGPSHCPLLGVTYMVGGCALFGLNDAAVKWLTGSLPVGELIGLRSLTVLVVLGALVYGERGGQSLRVQDCRGQLVRGGLTVASMVLFIVGLRTLPLADAIALLFAGPFISVMLAVLLLGEAVGWRRWMAVTIGFVGVVVILRPGTDAFTWVALLPLAAAAVSALRDILTRRLCVTESSTSILLVSTLAMMVASAASAPCGWVTPSLAQIGAGLGAGPLLGIAQFVTIEAIRYAEIGLIAPFRYSSMVWAVLFGFLFFDTLPDRWVSAGVCLVVGCGLYVVHREMRAARDGPGEAAADQK